MKCTQCSHENSEAARFCENCGQPLQRRCPDCGSPHAADAKFCSNCGRSLADGSASARLDRLRQAAPESLQRKILATRTQAEGERKTVTVLFADIVDSTALAEKLDPEEWGAIVGAVHQRVSDAVYRYEGTIAQLLGDGVLVFFGAPVAHEDDPERAVLAALEILTATREYAHQLRGRGITNFSMRIGLNSGLVVVGNIGSDMHVEYLALGDTVNLAARMQSAAEPDSVLISMHTWRRIKHAFDLEWRGDLELKGKRERVPAYRVLGAKSLAESPRGIRGLDSPLVGREREQAALSECLRELQAGAGRIVSVIGDAGLGKSRLVSEVMLRSLDNVERMEGRSLSFTASTPFAPFVEMLSRYYDAYAGEDDAARYAKIGDPFIATMLGVKLAGEGLERVQFLEPPLLREKTFGSLLGLFESLARQRPLLLFFEDLHWADGNSLELIERLMALTEHAPLLLLAAFRPHRQEASWRFHETATRDYAHRYTAINLEPLDAVQSRQLVSNLLTIDDLPESVHSAILAKAEGNPFYVEEVIRSLLDARLVVHENERWRATREIVNIAVPDTLTGVIHARLDRLDERAKRVAQTAAVIGREFTYDVLDAVAGEPDNLDASLAVLQQRELIREKGRIPARAYLFKHVLTQEAAYQSLLLSRRRDIHRRVAECLEHLEPAGAGDIARHYLEAQEPARALPFLVESAERAARAYATADSTAQFTRALETARDLADGAMARRVFEGLGGAQTYGGDPVAAMATYAEMEAYAKAHHDVPMRVSALNKASLVQGLFFAQLDEAEAKLNESQQLAHSCNDKAGLAEQYMMRCNVGVAKADFVNLVGHLDKLVTSGKELNNDFSTAFGLTHSANAWVYLARFDKAWEAVRAALSFARDKGDRMHLAEVLAFSQAQVFLNWGELDAAEASAREGARISADIGNAFAESIACMMLGSIARMRGDVAQSAVNYRQALRAGELSGYPFLVGASLSGLCATLVSDNGSALDGEAAVLYQKAQDILAGPMGLFNGGLMWSDLGDCALAAGRLDEADAFTAKGLEVQTTMTNLTRPRLLLNRARSALARGDCDGAAAAVAQARDLAIERGMKHYLPYAALVDADVYATRHDQRAALEGYELAAQLAEPHKLRPVLARAFAGAASALATLGRRADASEMRDRAASLNAALAQDAIAG